MDQWNLVDEFDLLANLPNEYFASIESKKWSERRDALQMVIDLCEKNPRLSRQTKYNELVSRLLKIVEKDSNVVCAAFAVQCLTALTKGLRSYFTTFAPQAVRILLSKFKETKQAVRNALSDSIDAVYSYCGSEAVQTSIVEVLQSNNNPSVIANTELWVYRILLHFTRSIDTWSFVKPLAPIVTKHSFSGDVTVREASYMVFAGVLRLLDEKKAAVLFDNSFADSVKKKKVDEYLEKAVVEAAEVVKKLSEASNQADLEGHGLDTMTNPENPEIASSEEELDVWNSLAPFDLMEKIPDSFETEICSKSWKERKAALESLLSFLKEYQRLKSNHEQGKLINTLRTLLEKDVNINVAALAAKSLSYFANGLRYDFAPYASTVLTSAFQKFKEKNAVLRVPLTECVDNIGLTAPFSNYIESVENALEKGNPQVKTQTALFLSRLWKQHSSSSLPVDSLKRLAHLLSQRTRDPDSECREAAYAAIGAAMKSIGENGVKLLFPEVTSDELKMAKISGLSEKFLQECGLRASVPITRLSLHFKTGGDKSVSEKDEVLKAVLGNITKSRAPLKQLQPSVSRNTQTTTSLQLATARTGRQSSSHKRAVRPSTCDAESQKASNQVLIDSHNDDVNIKRCIKTKQNRPFGPRRFTLLKSATVDESNIKNKEETVSSISTLQVKYPIEKIQKTTLRPRSKPRVTAKYSSLQLGRSRIPLLVSNK